MRYSSYVIARLGARRLFSRKTNMCRDNNNDNMGDARIGQLSSCRILSSLRKAVARFRAAAVTVTASVCCDRVVTASVCCDRAVTASVQCDRAVTASVCCDRAVTASVCCDRVVTASVQCDRAVTASVCCDQAVTASVCSDRAVTASVCRARPQCCDSASGNTIFSDAVQCQVQGTATYFNNKTNLYLNFNELLYQIVPSVL